MKLSILSFFCTLDLPWNPYYYVFQPQYPRMSRNHKEMPPIWRVQELLQLSDQYPSGLEWRIKKACNAAGSQAGRLNKTTGYYMVCIDNVVYLAHRVVYYLRTGTDPINTDVLHEESNKTKDNRKTLVATTKYAKKKQTHNETQMIMLK